GEIFEMRGGVDLFVRPARDGDVEVVHVVDDEPRRAALVDEAQPPDAHAVPARLRVHILNGPVVDARRVAAQGAAPTPAGVALVRTDAEPFDGFDARTGVEPDADAR